jgi:hypothetical protein
MGKKYAASTGGFYDTAIHGSNVPADAVDITNVEYTALLEGQSAGKIIAADATGAPVLKDPTKANADQVWELIKAERDRRKENGGCPVGDYWFHADVSSKVQHLANKDTARDQINAGGVMTDALLDPSSGKVISWKTMSGVFVPMTCQMAYDVVSSAKAIELAIFAAAEAHRVAMEVSAVPADYDFSVGWPATFAG